MNHLARPPLPVLLELVRAAEADQAAGVAAGEWNRYLLRDPDGTGRYEDGEFLWDESLQADLSATGDAASAGAAVERLAAAMRAFVHTAGWARIAARIQQARARGRAVVVTVRSAAHELYTLPWELLDLGGTPICATADCLLRYQSPASAALPAPPEPSSRVLVAWSGAVPAAEHVDAIAAAARAGHVAFDHDRDVLAHASVARLEQALAEAPVAILHLLCHGQALAGGQAYGLRLDGASEPATPAALAALLAPHRDHLRLVVLAACLGSSPGAANNALGSVAQAMVDAGIPAVVASRYPLTTGGSVALTRVLYQRLLVDLWSLDRAPLDARAELHARAPAEPGDVDALALQLWAGALPGLDFRPWILRPYRGLSPYGREDARLFFGRDQERGVLLGRMAGMLARGAPRFLLVAGASGTGKSSLVRAGLLADLEAGQMSAHLAGSEAGAASARAHAPWVTTVMRPGEGDVPAERLARHLEQQRSAVPAGAWLALVVDQLEELFTEVALVEQRESFLRALWQLACDPASGVFVVATIRMDYLGHLGTVRMDDTGLPFDHALLDGERHYLVRQLGPEQYQQIIHGPARVVGVLVEPGLLDRMRHALRGEPGALPLLSHALDQLWHQRSFAGQEVPWSHVTGQDRSADDAGERATVSGWWLTDAAYDALGGIEGSLARWADALYERLGPDHQAELRRVLVQLVHGHDDPMLATRRRGWRQALQPGPETAPIYDQVVDALVAARLLVQGSAGEPGAPVWLELAHEALIRFWPGLHQWYRDARSWLAHAGELRAMAEAWQPHAAREDTPAAREREEPYLLRGQRLRQHADAWAQHGHHLGAEEQRLVQAFLAACERAVGQRALADERAVAARDAALMAAARELVQQEQPAWATKLLAEVARPEAIAEWLPLVMDALWQTTLVATLRGHEGPLRAAVFSPDRTLVATAGEDGTARLWRADGQGQPMILRGHENQVTAVEISPDGTLVLTASLDGTARLWRVDDPAQVTVLRGHGGSVRAASFSRDGRLVLTASVDATARLWRVEDPARVTEAAVLRGHGDAVMAARLSADGKLVVTASLDGTARIWRVDDPAQVTVLRGHGGAVMAAELSPDGQLVVTASADATARVWSVSDPGEVKILRHDRSVHAATFSPDSKRVLTASADTPPLYWAIPYHESNKPSRVLGDREPAIRSAAFSPDGKRVVTASDDGAARVWDLQWLNGPPSILRGHEGGVVSATFSADGRRVVTTAVDKTARIWRVDERDHFFTILRGPESGVVAAAFALDGKLLVVVHRSRKLRLWNLDDPGQVTEIAVLEGTEDRVTAASLGADGRLLAIGSDAGIAEIWRVSDRTRVATLRGHEGAIEAVHFSPDGARVVTASADRTARIWRADGTGRAAVLRGHEEALCRAEFGPDGERIVTAARDGTARLWRATRPAELAVLHRHEDAPVGPINAARFSPDGALVLVAPQYGKPRLWSVEAPDQARPLAGCQHAAIAAELSPDGTRAATVETNGTVRLWRVADLAELAVRRELDDDTRSVCFSPDGKLLATAGRAGIARIWHLGVPDQSTVLRGHEREITLIAFSPDGKLLVTATTDGTVRLWPLDVETLRARLRAANSDCLAPAMRQRYMGETEADARRRHDACEREHGRTPGPEHG